ncbi:MAG: aminotransferase class V-fold PLP-dependent enzyme, partial [Candidatus Limnocylindrus sp.]
MSPDPRTLRIPRDLLPEDGRFGAGPSRVRDAQVDALASRAGRALMGTSHRQTPVRALVGRLRSGVSTLFALPSDYEVALGVGGATLFWDLAAFSLMEKRSAHAVHGEFSAKFAQATRAPHLSAPLVVEAAPGSRAELDAAARGAEAASIDAWALVQNETSTGVAAPVRRPRAADGTPVDGLTLVDATSAAGCAAWDPADADAYYFSPQKGLGADGGLWIAALSPAALERAEQME